MADDHGRLHGRTWSGSSPAWAPASSARGPGGAVTRDPFGVTVDVRRRDGDPVRRGRAWRPTRDVTRSPPPRCRRGGADGAGSASTTPRTRSCSTRTRRSCPGERAAWASWNVDTADCRRAAARAHDDVPHEPPAEPCRHDRLLRLGEPGAPISTRDGCSPANVRPSAVHVRDAGRPGRLGRLQGHRRTWYAGAHLGYGFHEDGCRSGYEAAAAIAEADVERVA